MRVVVVSSPGTVEVRRAPVPEPSPGELLVAMSVTGICGSDVHALHGRHPWMTLPYQPGHEVTGTVAAGGAGTAVPPGRQVAVNPLLSCGTCKRCRLGQFNLCREMNVFGCTVPGGGMADYFLIPEDRVQVLPDGMTDLQAALIEPLSTPVHAVRLAGPDLTGLSVVILGAGAIGLLTLKAARRHGATAVVMTDGSAGKRDHALRLGADAAVDALGPDAVARLRAELGGNADVVFDCVATQPTMDQAVQLALKGGTVMVVGVPTAPVTVALPEVQDQQVRIQGSALYLARDYAESMRMLADGSVRPEDFITARYPLADAAGAFLAASTGEQVKVVVTA